MRILSIRLMNLNSLAGEWYIDFTHPSYASDGIFAITGPTGSGKTTILDAVCLGLYGRTPRLDKVTKSTNEIMSRQAGECYAEVTFETQKGRYRCHWSQHRARKKYDGELQQAKHDIADAISGKVLESKITHVGGFIEKVTGMNFDQFTRSMLLAQGGFAAFLQATPDKRGPILEQITGTEIYSHISIKVHERSREESEKLDSLHAELKGIRVLTEEEEKGLQTALKEKQCRENEAVEKLNSMRRSLIWVEGIALLSKELEELNKKTQELETRRAAFEPEAEKLRKSLKALTVEGDYKGIVSLRRQQDVDAKELQIVTSLLPEKEIARAEAEVARESATSSLSEARARQVSGAEAIKKVRELDARLNEKKKQIEETDKALANVGKQVKAYKDGMEKSNTALKQSQTDLEAVSDYLIKNAVDASLSANLSAIGKSFAALGDIEARHLKACKDLSIALGKKESVSVSCKKIETNDENLHRDFGKKQVQLSQLAEEISVVLKDREISQWHDDLDALKERNQLLVQAIDIIGRIDNTKKALAELDVNLKTLQTDRNLISNDIKTTMGRKSNLEKDIENMETQVSLLSRIRDLEEDRKRLEDDKPCPLCGATDHPYARGNVPELDKAETALKKFKIKFKNESDKLSKLQADQAKKDADVQHVEKDIAEKKATLEVDERQCNEVLQALNVTAVSEERVAKVQIEITNIQALILETSGIVATAEEKSKQEKLHRTDLEKMRVQVENSGKVLQEAKYKFETAESDHKRLSRESDDLAIEVENIRAGVLKDVEPFRISQISSDTLTDVMKELTDRKNAWEAKQNEKTDREKKISDLKALLDRDKALLASLENDLAQRNRERNDLMTLYESLRVSRQELFGDKNSDREEKALADAVQIADQTLEKKREEYVRIEKEISALKEKVDLLRRNVGRRAEELAQAEQNLKTRIEKSGFENEMEFLAACLSEAQREDLANLEKSLIKEKTELDARKKDKSELLAAEREKNLTDQSREAIKENIDTGEVDIKQVRLDIGAIAKSLGDNLQQKEIQKDRIKGIEAQKKECMRWDTLRELIGSADGKKFRNFAQGLTFEMMTEHANRQLQKMTDRYLLIRDAVEPLELNVIDNYQAGEVRSTKNLSGGESFIVSLALALGLSRMASRNVRVDSLFLDEGFGTLDDDALETALSTLAELQQDGKLIGVISHVPALKERIGTQIQVSPETGGRSSLSGPGCERI